MVDEGCWSQPKLGTVLSCGVHDTEVILPVPKQHPLLSGGQFSDAAHQVFNLIIPLPASREKSLVSINRYLQNLHLTNQM